jgi:hypothetical protein
MQRAICGTSRRSDPGRSLGSLPLRQGRRPPARNCREKSVEFGAHVPSKVDVAAATPAFGALCVVVGWVLDADESLHVTVC